MPTSRTGNRLKRTSITGRPIKKRPKSGKIFQRDVLCIPHELASFVEIHGSLAIKVPRGQSRTQLVTLGLTAKLHADTNWTNREVENQMSSLFEECFDLNVERFKFLFLSTIPGIKVLHHPKVNDSFCWDGAAVQALGRGPIYILADENCKLKQPQTQVIIDVEASEEQPTVSCIQ